MSGQAFWVRTSCIAKYHHFRSDNLTWEAVAFSLLAYLLHEGVGESVICLTGISASTGDRREDDKTVERLRALFPCGLVQVKGSSNFGVCDLLELLFGLVFHQPVSQHLM